jgi:hypothetical protein
MSDMDEYDPGDMNEIIHKLVHSDGVVGHITAKAQEMVEMTGSDNFKVVVQNDPDTERPRAYGAPANNQGIHEELSDHVLLKAAQNMDGR